MVSNFTSDDFSPLHPGIYKNPRIGKNSMFTKSGAPGTSVYGERIFSSEKFEYRLWDPKRSKLGALYQKRALIPLSPGMRVLYLGASSGTTVSHVSDMLSDGNDKNGVVYSVEFSERPMRDLIRLASSRKNIIPILSDASDPSKYEFCVETVDVIFQDIAQPNQAEIAIRNATSFLKDGGCLILSIKSRSINTVENPRKIFKQEIKKLEAGNKFIRFNINKTYDLSPFHIDHMGVVATLQKKNQKK